MTIGDMLDWVLENWGKLVIIGGVLVALVKFTRSVDKLTRTVEDTKKEVADTKKSVKSLSDKYDSLDKKIDEQSESLGKMQARVDSIDEYHCENAERTRIMLTCTEACLRGMIEFGANGPVKAGLAELDDYKNQRASQ